MTGFAEIENGQYICSFSSTCLYEFQKLNWACNRQFQISWGLRVLVSILMIVKNSLRVFEPESIKYIALSIFYPQKICFIKSIELSYLNWYALCHKVLIITTKSSSIQLIGFVLIISVDTTTFGAVEYQTIINLINLIFRYYL